MNTYNYKRLVLIPIYLLIVYIYCTNVTFPNLQEIQQKIYKKCANENFYYTTGSFIGMNGQNIRMEYGELKFICNIKTYKDIGIKNTQIDIYISKADPDECYTCETFHDNGIFPENWVSKFIDLIIFLFKFFTYPVTIAGFCKLIEFMFETQENITQDENQNFKIKCPACSEINIFNIDNQKLFESAINIENKCVTCLEESANIFFPKCKHIICCQKCVKMLHKNNIYDR